MKTIPEEARAFYIRYTHAVNGEWRVGFDDLDLATVFYTKVWENPNVYGTVILERADGSPMSFITKGNHDA